jgi:hypothetical protein
MLVLAILILVGCPCCAAPPAAPETVQLRLPLLLALLLLNCAMSRES